MSRVGPGCFTTLHAAVPGGCAGALPGLVAAGAPLDATLETHGWNAPLLEFLGSLQVIPIHRVLEGHPALALAARCACLPTAGHHTTAPHEGAGYRAACQHAMPQAAGSTRPLQPLSLQYG